MERKMAEQSLEAKTALEEELLAWARTDLQNQQAFLGRGPHPDYLPTRVIEYITLLQACEEPTSNPEEKVLAEDSENRFYEVKKQLKHSMLENLRKAGLIQFSYCITEEGKRLLEEHRKAGQSDAKNI